MALTIDLRVPPGLPIPQVADFIKKVEDAGFDGVGVPEREIHGRDVYVLLTAAAARTSRIALYPAVTNPLSRHSLVLATLAHSLDEVAPDRVRIVVGSGSTSATCLGRPPASVEQMRSAVVTIRHLLAGEPVSFGNNPEVRLLNPPTRHIPVYIAATGPRMIELAGEVADGVMLMVGLHPGAIAEARRRLGLGMLRASRNPTEVGEIIVVGVVINDDFQVARERARERCFSWLERPYRATWLRSSGLDVPEVKRPEDIPDDLLATMCDFVGLIGPASYCAERLMQAATDFGIRHVYCESPITFEMPENIVEGFRQMVIPRLK